LRPYDAKKYEVPSSKIKLATGYAFLDVEPMPRAKIMKICYTVLEKLRTQIPEGVLYRIYTEEKIKYIMRITDEIDDIR
jgi:NADH dehydrogenase (ubiquinone) 1 alpha subcomplex subunit 5